jgi:predicted alpha/beta-hydrolase family hydrolase
MLASTQPNLVDFLLLLSYPLHPPRKPDVLRTSHFSSLRTPALFVHGTRDIFGSITEVASAIRLIPAAVELLPVESAGHELLTRQNRDSLPAKIVEAFRRFTS